MAKGLSPVQRTMQHLRRQGTKCAVVERWNQYAGLHGIRQDLFNIIDIIALDPEHGVIGIQACGQDFSGHLKKLTVDKAQDTLDWIQTPGASLYLYGWRKIKKQRGGKAMIWQPRIKQITVEDIR